MSIIDLPDDLYPDSCDVDIVYNNQSIRSPYNNKEQIIRRGGEHWVVRLTYSDLEQDQARKLFGTLAGLEGIVGTLRVKDYAFNTNSKTYIPGYHIPFLVEGSDNYGNTCAFKGPRHNGIALHTGDYINIGGRLHVLTEDAPADDTGRGVFKFSPRMITIPQHGQEISVTDFSILCRFKDDDQLSRGSKNMTNKFSFDFVEVL